MEDGSKGDFYNLDQASSNNVVIDSRNVLSQNLNSARWRKEEMSLKI